jgi:hypothetical protein
MTWKVRLLKLVRNLRSNLLGIISVGQIINLNKARKQKAREDKEVRAARNRMTHGQPKISKLKSEKVSNLEKRELDGKALSNPPLTDD